MVKRPPSGPATVLLCGAAILAVSMGVRHGFGLFLQPMSLDHAWGREVFAFALALQNLVWGLAQPVTGRLADRYGAAPVVLAGTALYVAGLVAMAAAQTGAGLALGAGVLIGLGLSGTTFAVVFGAVGRVTPPHRRSMAMGVCAAVGSLGQFAMVPGTLSLIGWLGWSAALLALGGLAVAMAPLGLALSHAPAAEPPLAVRPALAEAFAHRGFWLLCLGFGVCGFQVIFIAIHLPSYLTDRGLDVHVATTVLALVGLFNVVGTYLAGLWGGRVRKPWLLSGIYLGRAAAIAVFLAVPVTEASAYAFAVVIGLLWLSTVPLTNGTVAAVFGVGNLSMLGGMVFLFHQVGAFLGGWMGGYLYDRLGSYTAVWLTAIGLSFVAALANLPITEAPVARLRDPQTQAAPPVVPEAA